MVNVIRRCCLQSLVFLEAELSLHFGIRGHMFLPKVVAIMNFSHFDVLFDSKLCITRSCFFVFCFCLVICCRIKMTWLILKVVVYLSRFKKKEQRIGANSSKNNCTAMKKPKIRRLFAFSLFQNFYLVVI